MVTDEMGWTPAAFKEDLDIQQLFELYDQMFNISDNIINNTESAYNINYTKSQSSENKAFESNEKYFVNISKSLYKDVEMNLSSMNYDFKNNITDAKFKQTSNEILDLSTAENEGSDFVTEQKPNLLDESLNITKIESKYDQRQWEQYLEAKIASIIFNESFSENDNRTDYDISETSESDEVALVYEFDSMNILPFNESIPLVSISSLEFCQIKLIFNNNNFNLNFLKLLNIKLLNAFSRERIFYVWSKI